MTRGRMKKLIRFTAALMTLGLLLQPAVCLAEARRIGLITTDSKVSDDAFNQMAHEGLKRAAAEFGLQTSYVATGPASDYEPGLARLIAQGCQTIVAVGFALGQAVSEAAAGHGRLEFVTVDFALDEPRANVLSLVFAEDEAGFLAGVLAGAMSESRIVGVVAGKEIPPVIRFRRGFEAGVRFVCPAGRVLGLYIDSFTDRAKGRAAARAQVDQGADVIFGAAGLTGSAAILEAAQRGAWVIGVDRDEYLTTFEAGQVRGADRVLSSALKRVDVAIYAALKASAAGRFKGGIEVFGLANDGVDLAPFHQAAAVVPAAVKAKLEEVRDGLRSGRIKTGLGR